VLTDLARQVGADLASGADRRVVLWQVRRQLVGVLERRG